MQKLDRQKFLSIARGTDEIRVTREFSVLGPVPYSIWCHGLGHTKPRTLQVRAKINDWVFLSPNDRAVPTARLYMHFTSSLMLDRIIKQLA